MKLSKLLALVMSLIMVFSLAACTKAPAPASAPDKAASDTQEPAEQPAEEEENKEEAKAPEGAPELSDVSEKITAWNGDFKFKVNDKEFDNEALKDLSKWKVKELELVNSKGNASTVSYAGYLIKDVLAAAGCPDATKLTFICDDGYEVEYTLDDTKAPYTLVAIEKDKELAKAGVFFAPCLEKETSFYAKNVVEIKAE